MNTSKILVTDDEIRFCESIRVFLTMQGFDVKVAHSVDESVVLAENNKFDLFLVDKQMPDKDGFVFMDYAISNFPDVPFIMMTGRASVDSAILALKKGAYDYLKKPFKYEELVNTVNNAIEQKKLKTENRKITSMFRMAQKKYSDIIHNSPDLFFMLDQKFYLTFVNKTFETTLGYPSEIILNKPIMDLVYEADRKKLHFFLNDRRSKNSRRADLGTEIRMECKNDGSDDKKLVHLEIKKSSFSFSNGSGNHQDNPELCIVGRDISYRKEFEKQLIYSQKMEAVGVLAGGIAHNFNNLLMNIQGQATIMKMEIDKNHPCYEKFNAIERHINRGSNIARQLLNFARGGDYNTKPINMNYAIKDTLELFSISKKNIDIQLDLAKDLWPVAVDVSQMEQVFLNLLMNAHHAMPKGGDIFIKSENIVLDNKQADNLNCVSGKYIKLTVKDTGCGIEKNIQKKIFDPFFTTKNRNKGTGLGLSSAYGIIKKHHGKILVASEPGHGAIFTIYLYASNNETEPLSNEDIFRRDSISAERGRNHAEQSTIIVIDDDVEILEQSSNMLEAMGFNVITADSGQDGIKKYLKDHNRISLVILDMVMPGLNGAETFEYIKKINPDSRVLIITGYKKTNEIDLLLKDKTSAFLKKPYRIEQLSEKITTLLTRENRGDAHS